MIQEADSQLIFLYVMFVVSILANLVGTITSLYLSWQAWVDIRIVYRYKLTIQRRLIANHSLREELGILICQIIGLILTLSALFVSSEYYLPFLHDLRVIVITGSVLRTLLAIVLFSMAADSFLTRREIVQMSIGGFEPIDRRRHTEPIIEEPHD